MRPNKVPRIHIIDLDGFDFTSGAIGDEIRLKT